MTTNNQTSIASLTIIRRTYSAEFKQQIVQACKAPDVSIASVALQHGLNTNLVSKWIRLIDAKPRSDRSPLPNKPAFIALSCSAPFGCRHIHREIRKLPTIDGYSKHLLDDGNQRCLAFHRIKKDGQEFALIEVDTSDNKNKLLTPWYSNWLARLVAAISTGKSESFPLLMVTPNTCLMMATRVASLSIELKRMVKSLH